MWLYCLCCHGYQQTHSNVYVVTSHEQLMAYTGSVLSWLPADLSLESCACAFPAAGVGPSYLQARLPLEDWGRQDRLEEAILHS